MPEQTAVILALITQMIMFMTAIGYKHKLVRGSSAKVHNLKVLTKLLGVAGISVTTVAIVIILILKGSIAQSSPRVMVATWVGIGTVAVVLGSIAFTHHCPSCKRLNTRRKVGMTILDQQIMT
jgi:hypothetical protein